MPEQTYGGEDDSGAAAPQQPKKPDLKKFASQPDANPRDIFWEVMGSYALKKPPEKAELAALEMHKFPLLRIAETEIGRGKSYHGLGRNSIAYYTLMLCMDAGWTDMLREFMAKTYGMKNEADKAVSLAFSKLFHDQRYRDAIIAAFSTAVRDINGLQPAIAYMNGMREPEMAKAFKKELMIIARNDVESNQHNAILALAALTGSDDEVRAMMANLLSHWDEETRLLVAGLLRGSADSKAVEVAKRQLAVESDARVRKALLKLANAEGVLEKPKVSDDVQQLKKSLGRLKKSRLEEDRLV